jgi:cytochrome c oxidase assembly factor CtaG
MQWVLSAWNFDPWVIGGLLLAVTLYARGVATVWRRAGVGAVVSPARVVAFGVGAYVLVLAVVSPLDTLAHLLFSAHMVQHVALMLIAAPLLIAGAPLLPILFALPRRWRRAIGRGWNARPYLGRAWHALTGPVVVWCVLAATCCTGASTGSSTPPCSWPRCSSGGWCSSPSDAAASTAAVPSC